MDLETIEVCWSILQQYIKNSDRSHAVSHLVGELFDSGLRDEDLKKLAALDVHFSNAVNEHADADDDDWYEDDK